MANIGEAVALDTGTTIAIETYSVAIDGTSNVALGATNTDVRERLRHRRLTTSSTFGQTQTFNGDVNVTGYTGALGIKTSSAVNSATYVNGNLTVTSGYNGLGGGPATGVITVGSNYAYTGVTGNVTVTALGGVALGAESSSFNGSGVNIGGSVSVKGDLGATGVYDRTIYNHAANVTIGGNVFAASEGGSATGVVAIAGNLTHGTGGDVNVTVGGYVEAVGETSAMGVEAMAYAGDVNIAIGGEVLVESDGAATGIKSYAYGQPSGASSTIKVGSVYAFSFGTGNATGIITSAFGNLYTTVYGNVEAVSLGGFATGIVSYTTHGNYTNAVQVDGDVVASGYTGAVGVEVIGGGGSTNISEILIGGNVTATAITGGAYGLFAEGGVAVNEVYGSIYAYSKNAEAVGVTTVGFYEAVTAVGGDVKAVSYGGAATGVVSESSGGYLNLVEITGNVTANGYTGATGVYAVGGQVLVEIGGDVSVFTYNGNATGVRAIGDDYVGIGGTVSATSLGGDATGVYGNSTGYMGVHVGGGVYAGSILGNAIGIRTYSLGDTNIYVGGNVSAQTYNGLAAGVIVESGGYGNVTIKGNVYANSIYNVAVGVETLANVQANVYVGGNVTAIGKYEAIGVYTRSSGTANTSGDGQRHGHLQ